MDKKRFKIPNYKMDLFYNLIIIFGIITSAVYKVWWISICFTLSLVAIFVFTKVTDKIGLRKMSEYFESVASKFGKATTESMAGFPFPVAVLNKKGKITWYNSALDKIFEGDLLFQKDISSVVRDFNINEIMENGQSAPIKAKIKEKTYEIWAHKVLSQREGEGELVFAYFIDISDHENLSQRYIDEKSVIAIVAIDNYEEVMQGANEETMARINAATHSILSSWATENAGVIRKLERDRYIVIIRKSNLETLINKKFEILDLVRDISVKSGFPPTLSIGIGVDGDTLAQCDTYARAALDMALGRGGDQVVIKDKKQFRYFGGKTKEVEKRTRVKARVVAYALRELMAQSEQIIIMGHKNADIDCVGAAVGILSAAHSKNKRAYMLLNDHDQSVSGIIAKLKKNSQYENVFIKNDEARELINSKTLLIVADTHKTSYVDNKELLTKTDQIAIIDHHRRSADFIENAVLVYHEVYASSTSEMVAEILQYMGDKINLTSVEAEALYAGIYMDTKGFTFKTGVRTLEAAAYLRRAGADPIEVKKLFQSDFDSYIKRAEFVKSAEIYRKHIAISSYEGKVSPYLIAQAADELLNITGIDTSFVIAGEGVGCIISGRSTGNVNVQIILEKLGGGGHLSVAGAQLENESVYSAKRILKEAIEEYFKE